MISRRRFLMIAASVTVTPSLTHAHRWRCFALGTDVELILDMPHSDAVDLTRQIEQKLRHIEMLFSLYDQNSWLVRLNQTGFLRDMPDEWLTLLDQVDHLHQATEGLFDPTVQMLWQAVADGRPPNDVTGDLGWARRNRQQRDLFLAKRQSISFNGIAQGFATDAVCDLLRAHGVQQTLVNIGEHAAIGGAFRLGLEDPDHGVLGQITLMDQAVATSSPRATLINGRAHIMHPLAQPRWSTVSVMARDAVVADGVSTAMVLASKPQIRRIMARLPQISRVILVDQNGDVQTITAQAVEN
ncbi:FAD:protein FMN transferase [Pseudaestuariivita rosea]|uniref:FAD:protein FMN transferase n=1 Tax=Pseudaestuariivita rosea TaxID=2763263 RepID=UPI001ABABAD5|nr:FAD:protein FMN transferase [Pseudaestuariivita rosea]